MICRSVMTLSGLILLLLALPYSQSADLCYKGSRLYTPGMGGPDVCVPCQHGQFMPLELHTYRQCFPCTGIVNPQLEIFVSPCNITHDTKIHCIHGFYRTQPSYPQDRGHCQRCTQCRFPKRPCQQLHDTVCCHGDDYGVYLNKDGDPQCIRECGKGHFLDAAHDRCLPCPSHTYMEETKHINIYCKHCEHPTSEREKIVQYCNSTHPTVIDCADGYSRQNINRPNTDRAECLKLCGRGLFLDLNTDTCLTCFENTYMDEDRHSYTHCKQCQIPESQNEQILQPCSNTHPARIDCVDGFYRRLSDDMLTSTCERCRNCSQNKDGNIYEGRACGRTRNTVCCSRHGMTVVETLNGPLCIFLPIELTGSRLCGEGEYLPTDSLTCQPCPQGTYMDQTQHTNSSCKSCGEFPSEKFCPVSDHTMSEGNNGSGLVVAVVVLSAVILILSVPFYVMVYKWKKRERKDFAGGGNEENIPLMTRSNTDQKEENTQAETFRTDARFMDVVKAVLYLPPYNGLSLYAYSAIEKMVTSLSDLTVLVKVEDSSAHKPKIFPDTDTPYPYCGKSDRNRSHTGSGWVEKVQIHKGLLCPCENCQQSARPVTSWGEVVICTATSVVFDKTEGRQCRCYFFYDTDDTDLESIPSLQGARTVLKEGNWCYMTFVTHDIELGEKLQKTHTDFQEQKSEVREQRNRLLNHNRREENPLALIVSHPNGGPKKIHVCEVKDPISGADVHKYINDMCTRYDGAHMCILDDTEMDDLGYSARVNQCSHGNSWSEAAPDITDLSLSNLPDKKHL